jgi:NAD-specific glutamate dehydrogenase
MRRRLVDVATGRLLRRHRSRAVIHHHINDVTVKVRALQQLFASLLELQSPL